MISYFVGCVYPCVMSRIAQTSRYDEWGKVESFCLLAFTTRSHSPSRGISPSLRPVKYSGGIWFSQNKVFGLLAWYEPLEHSASLWEAGLRRDETDVKMKKRARTIKEHFSTKNGSLSEDKLPLRLYWDCLSPKNPAIAFLASGFRASICFQFSTSLLAL